MLAVRSRLGSATCLTCLLTDWAHLAVADDAAVQPRDRVGVRVTGDQEELARLVRVRVRVRVRVGVGVRVRVRVRVRVS